jgi:transposase-like protein
MPKSSCYIDQKSVIKDGSFKRSCDSKTIQRFRCKNCGKRFSGATLKLEIYQKKRRINPQLFKLLSSGVSMRRSAQIFGVHRITIKRKLKYLALKSRLNQEALLKKLELSKVTNMQFDDLITKENSKLKPLSVTLAVDANRRFILGAEVSQIPAFGHLSEMAKIKYGPRKCHHKKGINKLFKKIVNTIATTAIVGSDEHRNYREFIKHYFPRADYYQFKSERSSIAGQGELKKVKFDPLFAINHTCAMLRANVNRLIRKTWCTTKDPARLKDHLDIFIDYFNSEIAYKNRELTPIKWSS